MALALLALIFFLCRRRKNRSNSASSNLRVAPAVLDTEDAPKPKIAQTPYTPPSLVSQPFIPPPSNQLQRPEPAKATSDTSSSIYSSHTTSSPNTYMTAANEKRAIRLDPPREEDSYLNAAGPSASPAPSSTSPAFVPPGASNRTTLSPEQLELVNTLTQRGVTGDALATVIASMTGGTGSSSAAVHQAAESIPSDAPPSYHD